MKTTILTSFVTIALVAATSSFAIVVRAQFGVPDLTLPGPSFPAQSGLPLYYQPTRDGAATSTSDIQNNARPAVVRRQESKDEKEATDAQVLNFALSLELLERAFYEYGLSRYSKEDFKKAGYPDWVRARFEQIFEHEKTHVQFLESALTAAGDEYVKPCEYTFDDKSPYDFINLSEALETVGTSAYTGAIQYISNDAYSTAAASILATEARHASWINSAVRKQNPWNTAFETPLTINQVYSIVSSFIKPDSCPQSNYPLLPPNHHAYPQLTLAPKLIPGHETQISFSLENEPEHLYVAFLSGASTIFAPLGKKDGNYVVEIPEDLKAAGTVFVVVFKGEENINEARLDDESMVAGPAIAVFPFDSRGKYLSYSKGEKTKHGSD
ncbi:hypothetical protein BYT27DRAFT_7263222 [Phlegmacium glaucopus]|nr:hypothetical protein BYT27DRAFT_7263222 [Phlegmacium glaucopus]